MNYLFIRSYKLLFCQFVVLLTFGKVQAQIKTCISNPTFISVSTIGGTFSGQKLNIVNDVTLTSNTSFINCEINTSDLSNGIYVLRLTNLMNNEKVFRKIVVQHEN